MGQRLATAFIALFCILVAVWLLSSTTWATWYMAGIAVVVLCVAFVFGHVAFRGTLPGRFLVGGNAFIGGGRIAGAYSSTPVWQRILCAVFAIGGGIAVGAELVTGGFHASFPGVGSLALALGGTYLFGHVALRGRLPRPYAGGGNASLHFHNRRGDG
jgi:hypothetical protein